MLLAVLVIAACGEGGGAGHRSRDVLDPSSSTVRQMDLGLSGNGAEPPGEPRRPVEGLRLRALPSCGEPEFPVVHPYFEIVYGPMIGPAASLALRGPRKRCPTR